MKKDNLEEILKEITRLEQQNDSLYYYGMRTLFVVVALIVGFSISKSIEWLRNHLSFELGINIVGGFVCISILWTLSKLFIFKK